MENEKGNVIVSISAQDIYQHPDNPRKDLGDLSELSDSIAKKGIMQNLTVIQGHWDEDRNWHEDGYTLEVCGGEDGGGAGTPLPGGGGHG